MTSRTALRRVLFGSVLLVAVGSAWLWWVTLPWASLAPMPAVKRLVPVASRADPALPPHTLFTARPAAPAAPADLGMALAGIAGRLGVDAVALVRLPDGALRTLAIGGVHDGWTLVALSRDAALFRSGDVVRRVSLPAREEPGGLPSN